MTQSDNRDKSFSAFAFGLTIGIVGALAFGTEEGRKLISKFIDKIPDKYKSPPINIESFTVKKPIIPIEETPHHSYFQAESPPPPEPAVHPAISKPYKPAS